MDIAVCPNLIKEFFEKFGSMDLTEEENIIRSIILNSNNRILFSANLFEYLEKSLSSNNKYLQLFKDFTATYQGKLLRIDKDDAANDATSIKKVLCGKYVPLDPKKKRDLFIEISKDRETSLQQENSIVLNEVRMPSPYFILLKIASISPHSITLRNYDFKNNAEIHDIFNTINQLSNVSHLTIFDRQSNLDHSLFDSFKTSRKIFYYTAIDRDAGKTKIKAAEIKKRLPLASVHCINYRHIHERKILFGNLIVETDQDFQNIDFEDTTWKIDILYCQTTRSKLLQKTVSGWTKII